MPPPALTDDLVDEVLLRFPPEEPELLVRATLVCKRWFRVISDPRFRRRFRELHRAAPMLGFFCADYWGASRFVLVSSTPLPHAIRGDWRAVDVRHGRHLEQPLHVRNNKKVLRVHEVLNGARSSKSRMKCLVVTVDGNSERLIMFSALLEKIINEPLKITSEADLGAG
nr:unnamed protein product [Digitaria exilis]